jgi:hypothetical protein
MALAPSPPRKSRAVTSSAGGKDINPILEPIKGPAKLNSTNIQSNIVRPKKETKHQQYTLFQLTKSRSEEVLKGRTKFSIQTVPSGCKGETSVLKSQIMKNNNTNLSKTIANRRVDGSPRDGVKKLKADHTV